MKETATEEQIQVVTRRIEMVGLRVQRTVCAKIPILGVVGRTTQDDVDTVALLPGVHSVPMTRPAIHASAEDYFDCFGLTPRERQVVRLLVEGYSNKEIASRWRISEWTVKDHVKNVFEKVGIHQRSALVAHLLRLSCTTASPDPLVTLQSVRPGTSISESVNGVAV